MLALDPAHRGGRFGWATMRFVEEQCRSDLGLGVLRLGLLYPTTEHAFKVRFAAWWY